MTIEVQPITPTLGAEIFGADLSKDDHFETIFKAFVDYSVVGIHGLSITPEEHVSFAERWGEINVNRFFKPLEGHPRIATVTKEPEQSQAVGEMWHTDHSYDQIPAMCSLLYAIETPDVGGDTAFASMNAAYTALSDGMRSMLDGLKAVHSSRHVFGATEEVAASESTESGRIKNAHLATQDSLHPVVITHPLSGRRGIYVNRNFTTHIEGWTKEESEPLLEFIYNHCIQAEFTCRLRWKPGTMAIWDNRATWHKAINDYPGQRRHMHRIAIEGVAVS
jgi:taurine dioxygenase